MSKHVVPNADKPPAAQIAHLFFPDAKANALKNKRAIFLPTLTRKLIYLCELKMILK